MVFDFFTVKDGIQVFSKLQFSQGLHFLQVHSNFIWNLNILSRCLILIEFSKHFLEMTYKNMPVRLSSTSVKCDEFHLKKMACIFWSMYPHLWPSLLWWVWSLNNLVRCFYVILYYNVTRLYNLYMNDSISWFTQTAIQIVVDSCWVVFLIY